MEAWRPSASQTSKVEACVGASGVVTPARTNPSRRASSTINCLSVLTRLQFHHNLHIQRLRADAEELDASRVLHGPGADIFASLGRRLELHGDLDFLSRADHAVDGLRDAGHHVAVS